MLLVKNTNNGGEMRSQPIFRYKCHFSAELSDNSAELNDFSAELNDFSAELSDNSAELNDFFAELSDFFAELSNFSLINVGKDMFIQII